MYIFSVGKFAAGVLLTVSGAMMIGAKIWPMLGLPDVAIGALLLATCIENRNTPNFGG